MRRKKSESGIRLRWKRVVSLGCLLGLFCLAGCFFEYSYAEEARDTNLVPNPGFEETIEKNGVIVPKEWSGDCLWFEKPQGAGISQIWCDDREKHSGRYSLTIVGSNNRGITYRAFSKDVVAGAKYKVTCWMKCNKLEGAIARFEVVCKAKKDPATQQLSIIGSEWIGVVSGTKDWTEFTKVITLPPETIGIDINLYTPEPNTGQVWFDDISIIKLEREEQVTLDATLQC